MEDYEEQKLSEDPVMDKILKDAEFLRENFTEKDFLNYEPTREVLEINFINEFESKLMNEIENFYEAERKEMIKTVSNLFYYDTKGFFISELKGIIYSHVKPKYNLDIIYDSPHVAKSLITNYEDIVKKKHKKREREAKLIPINNNFSWKKNGDDEKDISEK